MSKPLKMGMSAQRLETMDRLMTSRYIDGGHIAGYQTMIYRRGQSQ